MEVLGKYILSVTSAAIVYSTLQSLLVKNSSSAILLRTIGGLFLTFTVLAPIAELDFDAISDTPWNYSVQGNSFAEQGRQLSEDRLNEIIKTQCEAYILDKAMSYQTPMQVEITLSQDETPVPVAVYLKGSISPYAKNAIQNWLQYDMGIPKENQIWAD